ncbi:hypothetical protein SBV1_2210027 [Verrucomicrobia bacterium]|nr:hypothetical protein SBV1_2210027 [Verrucomicrobiota bacterium]
MRNGLCQSPLFTRDCLLCQPRDAISAISFRAEGGVQGLTALPPLTWPHFDILPPFQQRFQYFPHIVGYDFVPLGGRVDAIRLVQLRPTADPFQEKGHQCGVV